ncbi:MAG: hypothetical protein COB35_06730 [Gammaproteobacteria bacterium]|nr:MAG: hypothetical protein COB35_06730 [Gammaproteobacteria bacterium]
MLTNITKKLLSITTLSLVLLCNNAANTGNAESPTIMLPSDFMLGDHKKNATLDCDSDYCKETLQQMKKYARWGNPDTGVLLAIAHLKGDGVTYDPEKAAQYLKMAKKHDSLTAMWMLSYLYKNGLGVDKNLNKAEYLLTNAAKSEFPPAMFQHAVELLQNEKNPQTHQVEAENLLIAASKLFYKPARYLLAKMYKNGYYVKKDLLAAAVLYKKLGVYGYKDSRTQLNFIKIKQDTPKFVQELTRQVPRDIEVITIVGHRWSYEDILISQLEGMKHHKQYDGFGAFSHIKGKKCIDTSSSCFTFDATETIVDFMGAYGKKSNVNVRM